MASNSMRRLFMCLVLLAALMPGSASSASTRGTGRSSAPTMTGLHVQGNKLLNGSGQIVRLHGVNRSGAEYACIQGWGIFDGPTGNRSIAAIASWHVNAVRVPLNEDCWLNINNSPAAYSGSKYRAAINGFVRRLNQHGMAVILDLHWTAPGTQQATGQQPMPDLDHAPTFWSSVASTFKANLSVIFDLFNEPYPDSNNDTPAAWKCWRNGGTCPGVPYKAAGMQQLVTAVRSAGARNVIMLGGVTYANHLSGWLGHEPADPARNLAASWHSYNFNDCITATCWKGTIAPVLKTVPVITGEIGENDCAHSYIDKLMPWLDSHGGSYLGWTWDTWNCKNGPALITKYDGTPTNFGSGYKSHLAALAAHP